MNPQEKQAFLALQQQVKDMQSKLDLLYSPAGFPEEILKTLVTKGFLKFDLYDVITYTNPSGKDFHSVFVRYANETGLVPFDTKRNYKQIESINLSTNVITSTRHGFSDGQDVSVAYAGVPPSPLYPTVTYFIRDSTSNTFKLALTAGGTAIDITTSGSGVTFLTSV